MAIRQIKRGATSQLIDVWIGDSSSTTGAGLTGLVWNSAGLTARYQESDQSSSTTITLATMTEGTWGSGGFKESAMGRGWYQLGIPDAALTSGTNVKIHLHGATNMVDTPIFIELIGTDLQDAVRGGMTALPNANAEAAGGLFTRGTGAGQINQDANGRINANVTAYGGSAGTFSGGRPEVNTTHWGGTAIGSAAVRGNMVQIDGQATSGNNATLNLKQLNIVNNAGDAIVATSTGSNGHGIVTTGHGTGSGLRSLGGATGSGVGIVGGGTSGAGLAITTTDGSGVSVVTTSGTGFYVASGDTHASQFVATGSGHALRLAAGVDGNALHAVGGTSTGAGIVVSRGVDISHAAGDALTITSSGSNGNAVKLTGHGTASGLRVLGGATGAAVAIIGGGTSGAGVSITTTDGIGLNIVTASGTGFYVGSGDTHAAQFVGTGSGHGFRVVAGDNGNAFHLVGGTVAGVGLFASGATNPLRSEIVDQINAGSGSSPIRSNTCQSGSTSTTAKLDASASATNNLYRGLVLVLTGGTGAGQARTVTAYNGTTKIATVDRAWATTPDNTTTFTLLAANNPALNANLQVSSSNGQATIRTGTAQAGAAATITLDAGASSTNNIYAGNIVAITGGTGLGQTRTIISYVGSTKVATVDRAWTTTPNNTSVFAIYASTTPTTFSDSGVAQAGGATSITLASTASATNDVYNGSLVTILSGTGAGGTREITDYDGTTKVATVDSAWDTNPDSTSAYAVIPTVSGTGTLAPDPPTPAEIWSYGSRTITGGTVSTVGDKTGYKLASDGIDLILCADGVTLWKNATVHGAVVLMGVTAGAGSPSETFTKYGYVVTSTNDGINRTATSVA